MRESASTRKPFFAADRIELLSHRFTFPRKVTNLARALRPHIPFTLAGASILSISLLALRYLGYQRMDLVVFALSVCAISIIVFCLVSVTLTGLFLRHRLRPWLNKPLPMIRAEAGYPSETGLELPALRWMPLVTYQWQIVAPASIDSKPQEEPDSDQLIEQVTPGSRCHSNEITRLFMVRDVLGLCRFAWRDRRPHSILVLPRTAQLRQLPALQSLDAEDGLPHPTGRPEGDRMDIRRYAPGDSVRNIMWRVYARNRHLNVRLPEKSLFHSDRTLAYLIAGDNDEAAAGVARFALTHGSLGSAWVFGADGSQDTAQTVSAALPLIAQSQGASHYGLDNFLRGNGADSTCVIFAPASPGMWTARLQRTLDTHHGPFTLVLAVDGLKEAAPDTWWQGVLTYAVKPSEQVQLEALRQLVSRLQRPNVRIVIVDRESGLSFDQHLKRV